MGSEQDGPFGALINALPDTLPPEVEELVKRLTIRARACESMALDFRDIGGRSADAKADECTAAFRDFRAAIDAIESLRASLTRVEEENARILGLLKEERSVANADLERFVALGDKWSARFMEGGRDVCDEVLRQIAMGNPPTGISWATSAEGKNAHEG